LYGLGPAVRPAVGVAPGAFGFVAGGVCCCCGLCEKAVNDATRSPVAMNDERNVINIIFFD
jgi:hypothetical protein